MFTGVGRVLRSGMGSGIGISMQSFAGMGGDAGCTRRVYRTDSIENVSRSVHVYCQPRFDGSRGQMSLGNPQVLACLHSKHHRIFDMSKQAVAHLATS